MKMIYFKNGPNGRFDWIEKMGVHEAYHQNPINRLIHWICIPLQIWGLLKFFSLIPFANMNVGLILLLAASAIYIVVDIVAGITMTLGLLIIMVMAVFTNTGFFWKDGLLGISVFTVAFLIQTKLGHGVFEKGVDDTKKNLSEFRVSKNPVPLVLIFYYHWLEVLFLLGYRSKTFRSIQEACEREKKKIQLTIASQTKDSGP